jgi:hypothetical protein
MYIYNEFLKYKISCVCKHLLKFCLVDMFLLVDILPLPREYAIRTNKLNSKFPQHILESGHDYDTTDQSMEILHTDKFYEDRSNLFKYWKGTHIDIQNMVFLRDRKAG